MRLVFSAGEASGDAYAAAILERLRRQPGFESFTPEAVGGKLLRQAGADMIVDSSSWGAIGIANSLKILPKVYLGFLRAKARLKKGTPGWFVPIDFGAFNVRLSKFAKKHGWKILYFVPPGSWRRDRQGSDLPALCDDIVTPFPWSADLLNQMGVAAHWFGHPMKEMIFGNDAPDTSERSGLAILPGSRHKEVSLLLPWIADELARFESLGAGPVSATFAVAPTMDRDDMETRWKALAPHRSDQFVTDGPARLLVRSRAALVCSGTATLQAALAHCPQVILYRVARVDMVQATVMKHGIEHVGLPNILLNRRAIPEVVVVTPKPGEVARLLDEIWRDGPERELQLRAYDELDGSLGPPTAITQTAQLLAERLRSSER